MQLVTAKDQIIRNLQVFDQYRYSRQASHQTYYKERLAAGNQFVMGKLGTSYAFAPSRFVGYQDCTCERHTMFSGKDGRLTTPALTKLLGKPIKDPAAEQIYQDLCASIKVKPANKKRTYWMLSEIALVDVLRAGEVGYPDEVEHHVEGATKRVVVNAYERDSTARAACIKHYGYDCVVCKFNFLTHYGEIGENFIHVHHLVPISQYQSEHQVDPIKDLRPVCPNCHAMLHRSDPPFTIEELVTLRKKAISSEASNR